MRWWLFHTKCVSCSLSKRRKFRFECMVYAQQGIYTRRREANNLFLLWLYCKSCGQIFGPSHEWPFACALEFEIRSCRVEGRIILSYWVIRIWCDDEEIFPVICLIAKMCDKILHDSGLEVTMGSAETCQKLWPACLLCIDSKLSLDLINKHIMRS